MRQGCQRMLFSAIKAGTKFERVLAPKVQGALALHHATGDLGIQLDFMVFFSSMSSILGIPGQSNYSAANAFLDALAYERRMKNLPALSINWGAWEEAGMMRAAPELLSLLNRRLPGIKNLTNHQGEEHLRPLLILASAGDDCFDREKRA